MISATINALVIGAPFLLGLTPSGRTYATTINSSTTTVVLQTLDPTTATFVAPAATTIKVTGTGISGNNSKDWQLTNNGSITTTSSGFDAGIQLDSATASGVKLDNFGSISAPNQVAAVQLNNGGTIVNHGGASISSGQFYGILATGRTAAAVTNIFNDGNISGSSGAVALTYGGSVTQSATGTLSSSAPGIINNSGPITINNAGLITSSASFGLYIRGTSTGTITNTGTISGAGAGVFLQGTAAVTLTNSGTITGTGGIAVNFSTNNNQLILQTGSVLNGSVTSSGSNNTLALQGNGSAGNTFSGLSTVSALGSGTWTLSGNVGTTAASAAALNVQNGTLIITGQVTNGGAGSGSSVSNGGTLQIGDGGAAGSVNGNVVTDSGGQLRFNRSDSVTYANVVSGSGGLTQAGQGGTLILTGNNTYTGGTNVSAGSLQIGNGGSIGSGAANIGAAGTLLISAPAGGNATFANALTGNGAFDVTLGSGTDIFSFGTGVGSAFAGTVVLNQGTFNLSGNNTNTLHNATLQLNTGNITNVSATGTQAVGNLTLNGGAVSFADLPAGSISTLALALNSGTVSIDPVSTVSQGASLLQQDDGAATQLISAASVSGSAGNLALTDLTGKPLIESQVGIRQNNDTVAIGSYNYGLSSGNGTGLYAAYTLSQLNLQAGQTLALAGDTDTVAGGADMKARITGSGGLLINATNSITLNNAANDYTGDTTVGGGTLVLGSDSALGNTALLALNAGTAADINGKTQTIGALGGAGTLDINAGNLTINNGGTFSGLISGTSGALTNNGGTLILTGDNTYTGTTNVAAGTLQIGDGGASGSYAGDITDNGAVVLNRSDASTYAGVVSGTGTLTQSGSGTTILTGNSTYSGGTTIAAGTLQIGNGGASGSIVGNVTDNGALVFNRSDSLRFDGIISGTGSVTQAGSGKVIFNGLQTYSGSTNITAGTLAVGDPVHTGAELAGGGLVTVDAAGALGGYGKVTGSVINNGLIGVGNALPAFANGPDATFTVAGNLDNRGTITMSNGVSGDRMIVSGGTYTSNGGKVLIDAVLNEGGPASNSDLLVVDATSVGAKGATQIAVTNVGGAGAGTLGNGIQVVQVQDPSHSAAGAFALVGRAVAGPFEYQLFQGGEKNPDGNWYLRSERDPIPPTPPAPPSPPSPPTPPGPPQPLYRPEVAAYLANQRVAAEMFVHSLDDRDGDTSQSASSGGKSTRPGTVWLRVEGRSEGSDSRDGTFNVNTDSFQMQGGAEVAQKRLTNGGDLLHLGLTASYMTARSNVDAADNPARAHGNVQGYSVGGYGTWYQSDERRLGAYADTWVQYGWFNNNVEGDQLPTVNYNAHGWAISSELGYALPLIGDWVFVPQGQLIYVDYQENSLTEPNGTYVDGANSSGVITRLGVRLQRTFQRSADKKAQFYATANWWHTNTDSTVSFNQLPIGSLYPANRYQLKLGVNGDLGKRWAAWSNVSGAWGAQSYHEYAVRLGVKYAW
ncbi:autotransporter outer membrane beta-barrel domain-containing protein [Burkholderia sp. S171]|uniref:autotransporter outer membrane beta-barrel domain-containing protein n=1 Tax=Burkholderia sp. S171 TaxID=1641860 RepID=UPI00131BBE95|nr:autotransporter outer membrane beta-barrel domain-containing protein [Burkholderia sp. S171]